MRVHSILRTKDSEAAAAIDELISLADNGEGGGGGFGAMIREIVEQSANPACLEAKLRSVGEEHLTVEVSKAFYSNATWFDALNRERELFGIRIPGRKTFCNFCLRVFDTFHNSAQFGPMVLIFP